MELKKFNEFSQFPDKTVLLGNGFSIDWDPRIFTYNSLFDTSEFSNNYIIKDLFEYFGTKDFEIIMRYLNNSKEVLKVLFKEEEEKVKILEKYYNDIKNVLVTTISNTHPDNPSLVKDSEYNKCANFLNNFVEIYTINYDLLLYWVIMKKNLKFKDGFWSFGNQNDHTFKFFNPKDNNFMFLHGALHLYSFESDIEKIVWNEYSIKGSLKNQVKEKIDSSNFPLIVSEGTSKQKLEKIKSNYYLYEVYKSLWNIKNLVTFGFSFSENDKHIYSKLKEMKQLENLIVGIYPKIEPNEFKRIQNICTVLVSELKQKRNNEKINLYFYDSTTANVWR